MGRLYRAQLNPALKAVSLILFGIILAALLIFYIALGGLFEQGKLLFAQRLIPFVVIFCIVCIVIQYFIIFKFMFYIRLDDEQVSVKIGGLFPKRFKYDFIHSISFESNRLKSIDLAKPIEWPSHMVFPDTKKFLQDFEQRYRENTGRELVRVHKWTS
ncbi:MAG: hypothetical protein ACOCWQ_00040 [Nanoarchaeota archaeon]